MADRHPVRGAQTTEVVPLHRTGKALTDRSARDIHELAREIVVRGNLFANLDEVLGINAKLGHFSLGFDLCDGKVAAHGLACPLGLGRARAELHGRIAVFLGRALCHNLKLVELKNGHRDLFPVLHEKAGHPDFFCNNAGAQHE